MSGCDGASYKAQARKGYAIIDVNIGLPTSNTLPPLSQINFTLLIQEHHVSE